MRNDRSPFDDARPVARPTIRRHAVRAAWPLLLLIPLILPAVSFAQAADASSEPSSVPARTESVTPRARPAFPVLGAPPAGNPSVGFPVLGAPPVTRAAPATPVEGAASVAKPSMLSTLIGTASRYADMLHGRRTSSGERHDRTQLTAAHRTLPLGTLVRVTELQGQRSVVVRINDRGPFSGGHLIDLSRAAAERLGMLQRGTATVRLEVVDAQDAQDAQDAPRRRPDPAG